jgi:REP element-mobilizing transposase RayT
MTVIAYHLIWTSYGTWLSNDPRGSGSLKVYSPILAELGAVHFGPKKVQPSRSKVREFYAEAESRLQFPVLRFDALQRSEIGDSFAEIIRKHQYTCHACAIMPDHVHLVIRKHNHSAELMIESFQHESRAWLLDRGMAPEEHPVWTKKGWHVFLNDPPAVWGRIQYVERNPMKEGLTAQQWPFVVVYDNWPFHKKMRS